MSQIYYTAKKNSDNPKSTYRRNLNITVTPIFISKFSGHIKMKEQEAEIDFRIKLIKHFKS